MGARVYLLRIQPTALESTSLSCEAGTRTAQSAHQRPQAPRPPMTTHPRRYLFLGDSHADIDFAEDAMHIAKLEECQEIIQLGDWGFHWPNKVQVNYLSVLLQRYNVTMRFIDGNHDNHDWLDTITPKNTRDSIAISPNLIYQPRGSVHVDEDGTRFLFVGGAPSIDKDYRTPGKSWWPQEALSEEQYQFALAAQGPFDVLVTHDVGEYPPGYGPKGTAEFLPLGKRSMEMMAGLAAKHVPTTHIHGHWHTRYDRHNGVTHTIGLASNVNRFSEAFMVWSK